MTNRPLQDLLDPLPNSEIQIADGLHLVAFSPEEYEPVSTFTEFPMLRRFSFT